jgi:hypothetical protein
MPTPADEARSQHQATRAQILMEDWDDVAEDWVGEHVDEDVQDAWGVVDTSANSLADMARQLSTPGLYGRRNTFRHRNTRQVASLVGPDGHLERARYFARMPFIQYLTLGLGDMFIRWTVDRRGRLRSRKVWPHDVYLVGDPENPSETQQLWELRRRYVEIAPAPGSWRYVWDCYDLGDPATGRPPSFRCFLAEAQIGADEVSRLGKRGAEVSRFVGLVDKETGGPLVGEAYPWFDSDGVPRLPWSHYKDADTDQLWNVHSKRGAHRGTLNTALYWTYAGHCARAASGSYVAAVGMRPTGIGVRDDNLGEKGLRTVSLTPGSIHVWTPTGDDVSPQIWEIGPGVNLDSVVGFADKYEMKQAVRWGLNPSDLSRTAANPASGAALMVRNKGKREFSEQVEAVFRAADLNTIEVVAVVCNVGGLGQYPTSGYTVEYQPIPKGPQERQADLDDLDWRRERGQISEVDVYIHQHPGTTEDDAIAALVAVRVAQARLERATAEALTAAQLDAAPAPVGRMALAMRGQDAETNTDAGPEPVGEE